MTTANLKRKPVNFPRVNSRLIIDITPDFKQSFFFRRIELVADIRDSLPVQRRPIPDWAKALHVRVTLLRRNGYCPSCQQIPVCSADGKNAGAALHRDDLLVVDANEYDRLLKRLNEAEAFRRKVTIMPARDVA